MELSSQQDGALQVVSVNSARIDAAVAIEFKDAMRQTTDSGSPTVILDLSHVEFIDSSGLGAIVASMKHMGQDRSLVLAGLTPTVDKVFRLTRMDSVFGVFPTLETALDAHAA
ncbi:MAG: STAS domain-containing protein [Pseudomonadota bacterium]